MGKIKAWFRHKRRWLETRSVRTCRVLWRWLRAPLRLFVVIALIVAACLIVIFPEAVKCWVLSFWIWSKGGASNAETLRNLGLAFGAAGAIFIGIPLALWRNLTADRQTKISNKQSRIANKQAETANEQARIAERNLNNERYQKGAEMLGSEMLGTRMGGVYALGVLAQERPDDYYIQIANLLRTFIRHPTEYDQPKTKVANEEGKRELAAAAPARKTRKKPCSPAVEVAAQVLGKRSERQIRIEQREEFRLDLRGAYLSGADLDRADFSGVNLERADLARARLYDADFSRANLYGVNLARARLFGTDLSRARLTNANLSRASLYRTNLSRARLLFADLSGARLLRANLSGASLLGANLSGADLDRVDFSGADLEDTDLSGADFKGAILKGANLSRAKLDGVKNLTQKELDDAFIWEGREPPSLEGAVDPETGKPLVWRGEERPDPDADPDPDSDPTP